MVDEMLVTQSEWLPQYKEAIQEAAYRLENDELIPTQAYEGAARLHTKTVEEMALDREEANKNAGEADKAKERPASE